MLAGVLGIKRPAGNRERRAASKHYKKEELFSPIPDCESHAPVVKEFGEVLKGAPRHIERRGPTEARHLAQQQGRRLQNLQLGTAHVDFLLRDLDFGI